MENKLNFDYFVIEDNTQIKYYGGDQEWYKTFPKRMAGCGPTTASNITMYELRKQEKNKNYTIEEFLDLMNTLWNYVTPGVGGVSKIEMFEDGYDKFLKNTKLNITQSQIMKIPSDKTQRPSKKEAFDFLSKAIKEDHPIAFLNLDNGKENRLESWHWVTIAGVEYIKDSDKLNVTIVDNSRLKDIDLGLWIETTRKDGGFIYYK